MPRYHFDVEFGLIELSDDVGSELPDDQVARDEAFKMLADVARDRLQDGNDQDLKVKVRNARGEPVAHLVLTVKAVPPSTS